MVKIRWGAVDVAKNYVLQVSREVMPLEWEQLANTGKSQVTTNLPVGQSYVFRVAACGVPGQSNWSSEVICGVA